MKVIVIGGGASGMIAAIIAAKYGHEVTILEKMESLGKKVKITGKGRCNLTFSGDEDEFKHNIVTNAKFMYSSFSEFSNKDVIAFFEQLGVATKVERGGRVFPVSDCAEDVVEALKKELKKLGVTICYHASVKKLLVKDGTIMGVQLDNDKKISCDKVILATGGKSYSTTGSTGDGYRLAKEVGHQVIDIVPGLVPLVSKASCCKRLQGLSLRNVEVSLYDEKTLLKKELGEMMFSHFGLTGPIILSFSSIINRLPCLQEKLAAHKIIIKIDLKPGLSIEALDKRICRDFEKYANKEFKNSLNDLLPQKLIPEIIKNSQIDENKKVHQITRLERIRLGEQIKNFEVIIDGLMPIDMAIITCGGINIKEVNPKTMESKIVKKLFFAGELLDIDAYTGGFNLQIAFSTGYAAGRDF